MILDNINADFNPGTLSDLAGQGTHGVEVIVVAALSVIVCALLVFLYRFYREARKYDLLRDESIKELTETVQKYSAAADQRFEKIADSLDRLEEDVTDGIKQLSAKVERHGEAIGEHEKRLNAVDKKIEKQEILLAGPVGEIVPDMVEESIPQSESKPKKPAKKRKTASKK